MVSITYANISPLVLVMSLCYFSIAPLIYKHQLLYVYDPVFETGGKLFPHVFHRFFFALVIANASMMGMMILKEALHQFYVLAVVLISTLIYHRRNQLIYGDVSMQLPLEVAAGLDVDMARDVDDLTQAQEVFIQPELRAPAELVMDVEERVANFCKETYE
jgi:hypothetical protein